MKAYKGCPIPTICAMDGCHERTTCSGSDQRLVQVLRIIADHPEYPEPCPLLHEVAAKAAAEMDKEWVMHMAREACRQTKAAIIEDIKHQLLNERTETRP